MMKKNIFIILVLVCTAAVISSCSKQIIKVAPTVGTDGYAFLKVAHYSPNFRQVTNNRDSFNVYVGNVSTALSPGNKLNGGFLTYGAVFPSSTNLYAAVNAGTLQAIRITLNGVTTPDSITLATFTKTLTAGAYYSLIITDSLLNSSDQKRILMQDEFVISDTTHFTMRMVHAILNDTLGKNVDVYSTRLATNIFSNISPGTVTPFTTQPYNFISDTLIVRRAGGFFELARLSTVASPLARQRAYTLVYKGLPSATTGTKARSLFTFLNQ